MLETYHLTVSSNGRIVLPAELRERYDLDDDATVVLQVDEEGMHLKTLQQTVAEAQRFFTAGLPTGTMVSDELIRERREESARE